MERLNGDLKALADAERGEAEPSAEELERARLAVLRRVGTAAAAGAVVGTLAKSAQAGATAGASAAGSGGLGLAVKLGVSALVLGGLTAVAVPRWSSSAERPTESAVTAPAAGPPVPFTPTSAVATPSPSPEVQPAPPAPPEPAVRLKPQPGSAPPPERNAPPLAEEVRLLKDAQAALKAGHAAAALGALAEHQRRFPGGQLALERSAVRISALCALGRTEEAKRAARSFLERHGGSGLAEQVRGSCAGGGTTPR